MTLTLSPWRIPKRLAMIFSLKIPLSSDQIHPRSSSSWVSSQAAAWSSESSGSTTFLSVACCSPAEDFSRASRLILGGRGRLVKTPESRIQPANLNPLTMSSKSFLSGWSGASNTSRSNRSLSPRKTCLTWLHKPSCSFLPSSARSWALLSHLLKKLCTQAKQVSSVQT